MMNLIYILILISTLFSNYRGWTHPETGWEIISGTHMCIFIINDAFINNEYAEHEQTDAIGIFFDNQCIGWGYYQSNITIIPTIGDNGDNPEFPVDGDEITLYIYDDSEGIVLNLQSTGNIPLWNLNTMPTIPDVFACSFNMPIQDDGICPNDCDADLNADLTINLLDIIYLVDIILNCDNCGETSCGDINGDNQINLQDIIIILQIILDD